MNPTSLSSNTPLICPDSPLIWSLIILTVSFNSLLKSIDRNEEKIYDALKKDLNKHEFESFLSEILLVKREIKLFTNKLNRWSKKKKVRGSIFNFPSKNYLVPEPYGNVLIITPWNYPFQLSLTPLIGAIAAGNSVIIKPSELAPNTSSVLKDLIESVFPRNLACVVAVSYTHLRAHET